jgi:hypothetical protein
MNNMERRARATVPELLAALDAFIQESTAVAASWPAASMARWCG